MRGTKTQRYSSFTQDHTAVHLTLESADCVSTAVLSINCDLRVSLMLSVCSDRHVQVGSVRKAAHERTEACGE